MILSSLQAHCSKIDLINENGGYCPTIGCTDLSLPKIIEGIMNEEIKTKVVGTIEEGKYANMHEQSKRVFGTDGIAPTQHCCGGGNLETKILEPINAKDGLNSTLTTDHDRARNITDPNGGHKQMGVLETTIVASRGRGENNEQHLEERKDGLTNTITTVQKDNMVVLGWSRDKNGNVDNYHNVDVANCQTSGKRANTQNYVMYRGKQINDGEDLYLHDSERFAKGGNEVSRTLKSEKHDAGVCIKRRIRKLTERECFRLMGVNDKDIDTIQAAQISKTQQYKMAGNSIVVDVLDAIFSNLFFPEMAEKPRQLTLF